MPFRFRGLILYTDTDMWTTDLPTASPRDARGEIAAVRQMSISTILMPHVANLFIRRLQTYRERLMLQKTELELKIAELDEKRAHKPL